MAVAMGGHRAKIFRDSFRADGRPSTFFGRDGSRPKSDADNPCRAALSDRWATTPHHASRYSLPRSEISVVNRIALNSPKSAKISRSIAG